MIDTTPTDKKLEFGQVITIGDDEFEVSAVSAAGPSDAQYGFRYELILHSEGDAIRAHNEEHAKQQEERAALENHARVVGIVQVGVDRYPTNDDLKTAIKTTEDERKELIEQATGLGETDTSYIKYPTNARLNDFIVSKTQTPPTAA